MVVEEWYLNQQDGLMRCFQRFCSTVVMTVSWKQRWLLAREAKTRQRSPKIGLREIRNWYKNEQSRGLINPQCGMVTAVPTFWFCIESQCSFSYSDDGWSCMLQTQNKLVWISSSSKMTTDDVSELVVRIAQKLNVGLINKDNGQYDAFLEDDPEDVWVSFKDGIARRVALRVRGRLNNKKIQLIQGENLKTYQKLCSTFRGYNLHCGVVSARNRKA